MEDDVRYRLTNLIKEKTLELGFAKVGIARAAELTQEGKRLQEWLRRNYHATMEWMERNAERRIDPRAILPEARSVICVAMNYYTPLQHSRDSERGKISRYAWGDDYHIVLAERLALLVECIKQIAPDALTKAYVDTGPVMEKAWAARAGLGWIGKHTNLITRDVGSWVFLGEVITNLDLVPDEPGVDHCGTCRACIDACPTHAIVEPYVLDSTKCISYLTIEHRGEIPDELATKFENWVYGCDICQDVCPWNSFQQPSKEQAFQPRAHNVAPRLEELTQLTVDEFRERYHRSPIKRTKREGLARNADAILRNRSS